MARVKITGGTSTGGETRAAQAYGPRHLAENVPGEFPTRADKAVQEIIFTYDNLPVYSADALVQFIPANSRILSATLYVLDDFAGGTSYNIGLYEPDGTLVDVDGIAAGVAVGALTAGAVIVCDGAYVAGFTIDTTTATDQPPDFKGTVLTVNAQVHLTATGTFTAGKAKLTVEYELLLDRSAGND